MWHSETLSQKREREERRKEGKGGADAGGKKKMNVLRNLRQEDHEFLRYRKTLSQKQTKSQVALLAATIPTNGYRVCNQQKLTKSSSMLLLRPHPGL